MRLLLRAGTTGLGGLRFQERVTDGLQERLGPALEVERVDSMRGRDPRRTRRLPLGLLERRSLGTVRRVGGMVWGSAPTHRFDTRLPPARHEVVTVLDLAPLHFPDEGSVADWLLPSLRDARGALCLSPSVAAEVEALADIPTWVTGAGCDPRFVRPQPLTETELAALGIHGRFVLAAGGSTERKDLTLLARAWAAVRAETDLTLVSVGPDRARRSARLAGVDGVLVLGEVDDTLVPRLLASAEVLAVPSRYEGFGMPVVEAMASGTPSVVTDRSSLPWVAGGAALVVPAEPADFAGALLRACFDSEVRARLRAAGDVRHAEFTWDRVVQAHLDAYAEAFGPL